MPPIIPKHSKSEINRAGDTLISADSESEEYTLALKIVQSWRSSHEISLQEISDALKIRAKTIDQTSQVTHRPKRLPSIQNKLARLKNTRLARMQDIGGCRAILKTVGKVYQLFEIYENTFSSYEPAQPQLVKVFDYILHPKPDGYRCLHLILNHQRAIGKEGAIDEYKIEIQIRTQLQHHWATAVETAATFLGPDLKAGVGDPRWLRFFALASSVFAILEECEAIPETPKKQIDLIFEIGHLWRELQVDVCFGEWLLVSDRIIADYDIQDFLIISDSRKRSVKVQGFTSEQTEIGIEALNNAELEYAGRTEVQVAKVSVDNILKLKEAYPNYYADTREFINELNVVIELEYEHEEEREDDDPRPEIDFIKYK